MANTKISDLIAEASVASTDIIPFVDLSVGATRKATVADIFTGAGGISASSTNTLSNKSIALGSNTLTGTSAQLATAISDETGSGALTFATAPTFATINMNNTDIQNIKLAEFSGEVDNDNSSTADTIDWGAGNFQKSTLTGSCTYTFTAPSGPARLTLKILTGAGSFAVTWPASVKWTGGTAPTITTTATKIDLVTFWYDGTNFFGTYTQNYTG